MKNFTIEVIETYSKIVYINANTIEDAIKISKKQDQELMGEYDHFKFRDFKDITHYTDEEVILNLLSSNKDFDIEVFVSDTNKKLTKFTYNGDGDCIKLINDVVTEFTKNKEYFEYIDSSMFNPWVSIVETDKFVKSSNTIQIDTYTSNRNNTITKFSYNGDSDPLAPLDKAVREFSNDCVEYIDVNMDVHYVRLIEIVKN